MSSTDVKIYIAGGPGSGKTTLARRLSSLTGAPAFDLDQFFWHPHGPKSSEERQAEMERIMSGGPWIAEGVYSAWADSLLECSDVIIWMEAPLPVALWRIVKRHVRASLAGNNKYPGLWRLLRFLRTTIVYHMGDSVEGSRADHLDATRKSTRRYLSRYSTKVIGPKPRNVERWVRKAGGQDSSRFDSGRFTC